MQHKYLSSVIKLKLDTEKCVGCGMCNIVCPHEVFGIKDGKAYIKNKGLCMECGACSKNCAFGAIEVKSGVG